MKLTDILKQKGRLNIKEYQAGINLAKLDAAINRTRRLNGKTELGIAYYSLRNRKNK